MDTGEVHRSGAGAHSRRYRAHTGQSGVGAGGRDQYTPIWFDYLVLITCGGVLSFGGFGLLLAVLGRYSTARAFSLGLAGTAVAILIGKPARDRRRHPSPAMAAFAAGAMVSVAAGIAVWNAIYIGHHVSVDRDPGTYAVTGRWIAGHGSLTVPAAIPWAGKGMVFKVASLGTNLVSGKLQFQSAHLLPVLLAEGYNLGGNTLMFIVPAVLGAIGLCAIYAVGCRLIRRPILVLAAVTGLGVSLPELSVTRDTYSEPATQVLIWGGIWLLLRCYEERRVGVALLAGMALGGTLMTRIDASAYLIPLPLLAAVGWLATAKGSSDRRSILRIYGAALLGLLPPAVLGTIDLQRRSTGYYDDLQHEVLHLDIAVIFAALLAGLLVVLWPRLHALRSWLTKRRTRITIVACWVIATGLLLAWTIRPAGVKPVKVSVLPKLFAQQTVRWMGWYMGPVSLALAIAGLCVLLAWAVGRNSSPALVVLAMSAPLTALYLWNPSITDEQIWAMRRFVPVSLPLLFLAAAVAVEALVSASRSLLRDQAWPRRILIAGAATLVVFPLGATFPVRAFQPQANFLALVERTCRFIGPDSAVLFPIVDRDGPVLMQTIRSWCNVPAAQLTGPTTEAQLEIVADDFRSAGKTLWVLGYIPLTITKAVPGLTPVLVATARSDRELQRPIGSPVDGYGSESFAVYAAKVPA